MKNQENIILVWNRALLHAVRTTAAKPPMVARSIALLHMAMYDAWTHYHPQARALRTVQPRRLPAAQHTLVNKAEAMSFAAFRVLCNLFQDSPSKESLFALFGGLMRDNGYDSAVLDLYDDSNPADPALLTPARIGNTAAQHVIKYHETDGSNQQGNYEDPAKDYLPANEPMPAPLKNINRWQALNSKNKDGVWGTPQSFLYPHWGWIKPFVIKPDKDLAEFTPPTPYPRPLPVSPDDNMDLTEAEKKAAAIFEDECRYVLTQSRNLNDETKSMADYWADGPSSETPPGHWCLLARQVSLRDTHTLDEDTKLFCALGVALFESSIACWRIKREQDTCRPIVTIRNLLKGEEISAWAGPYKGTQVFAAEMWQSYLPTPSFAEFVSGHSTFSSASATILRLFTKSDYFGGSAIIEPGSSKIEPGFTPGKTITLKWPYFTDAAKEAGMSRIHGGIHFRRGNEVGFTLGKKVGTMVWNALQPYFTGK